MLQKNQYRKRKSCCPETGSSRKEQKDRNSMIKEIIVFILAGISILYGFVILAVRSGSSFFMVWFAVGILLAADGICTHFGLFSAMPKALHVTLLSLLGAALAVFLFAQGLVISGFFPTGERNLDYILVLGAQIREDGPSVVLRQRLDTAVDYLNENPETKCIVSGGQGHNESMTEAQGMKIYLTQHGIAEDRILTEDRSENTVLNIRNSMCLFDAEEDRVGIVTSDFHMYRSTHIAKKQGVRKIYQLPASSTPLYLPNNAVRDAFGIMKDTLTGAMTLF